MNVLLLAGERLRRRPPSRGIVGEGSLQRTMRRFRKGCASRFGAARPAQIILKSQDFTRSEDFMQKRAPVTVPKK
jgi:hypothetical protein